jgi:hypothetical protein
MGLAIEDIGTPGIDKLTKAASRSRVSSCSINKLTADDVLPFAMTCCHLRGRWPGQPADWSSRTNALHPQ